MGVRLHHLARSVRRVATSPHDIYSSTSMDYNTLGMLKMGEGGAAT